MERNDSKLNFNKRNTSYNIKYPKVNINCRKKNDTRRENEIYTDGSKLNNQVGSAMVVYKNKNKKNYHKYYRLNNDATVYMAEVFAIDQAIDYVIKKGDYRNNDFAIISDSMSALKSISSLNENRTYITNIRNKIYNLGIDLFWTRAHVGNHGNEEADVLAKKGTNKGNIDIEFHSTRYQLKKMLNHKYMNECQGVLV